MDGDKLPKFWRKMIMDTSNIEVGLKNYDFLKNMMKDILYPVLQNVTEKLTL
jgi:hypothetical protein